MVADAHLVLPTALADQAARATGVLWRIGWGQGPLTGYHDRFLDRYGPHRFVPLLETTDPAVGLGLDIDVSNIDAAPQPPGRAAVLAAVLAQGTVHGGTEVVLDAGTIAALAGDQTAEPPPRTAEIHVRVLAATQQDLAAGRLHLAVCPRGGSQDAGSSQGRFTGLLPGTLSDQGEPLTSDQGEPSMLVAELVVRPRVPEGAALAPQTGFAPWRIPVGVPVRDGDLVLDDLLLVSNSDRLIVWSASQDRQVVPVLYSRLAPRLLPPLARFLQLLGQTGCRPWRGWSWGPLADLPFQPRVRYERVVLSPARWVLPRELTGAVHDRTAWNGALHAWRTAAIPPPPDIVVTEDADRRLPLDLRRPDDRELLRRYVRRGVLAVTEQPGGLDAVQAVVPGPTGNHVLELVVPLARRTSVTGSARPATTPVRTAGTGLHLPGGEWLSLAVRSPANCHDQILSELAAVVAGLIGHFDTWFWLRYTDTTNEPHIRARFHGKPATLGGQLLPALSAWCAEMIGQRTAIQDAAQWLLRWHTNTTSSWPPYVTGDELDSDTAQPTTGRRDAWCYGAPGIGRALTLAGRALADPRLTEAGDTAIASLAERPAELWDVAGPTLCHGHAGVLQSAATSRGSTADRATAAVREAFDPRLTFAFQHLDNGSATDEPDLLTGSAGVALALADHGQLPAPPVPARWDAILLLS